VPRERLTFRQRDLKAALKAAKEAGISVARIEVGKNGIVIVPGELTPAPAAPDIDPKKLALKEAIRNEISKHVPPDER
jgi:hypothetical protein